MSELFLHIFNTGITAGWLVLAVVATRLLLKKAPAWIKCALWAIVALRLVWPFEIESILSLIPSTQTLPPAELHHYAPQLYTGISAANSAINPVFTEVFAGKPTNSVNPLQVAVSIASYVWVIGMVAMVVYAAVSFWRLRRRVLVSMPVGDGVYLCDHIASPFILGLFRPRIYLPSELSQEKWESILAHERAHLARKDHWWKPLGFVMLTVFWFHPLLWLAYILLCRDVELACDEKVIASLSAEEKQAYSETLLECSMPKRWITACPLAFGEIGVKQRIKAVLHYKKPTLWIIIVALIVGSVLAVCFLTEPEKPSSEYPGDLYVAGEMINVHIVTGYLADMNGTFRITDDGILQFDPATLTPNGTWKNVDWQDLGQLESFVLTEDNFDNRFPDKETLADTLQNIRGNNRKAWRVPSDYGQYHYFLLQNDGTCYFMYGQSWLYRLIKQSESIVAGKSYIYEKSEDLLWQFVIHIQEDGTFSYFEGVLSSYIGHGEWEQKDEKLYLYDEGLSQTRTFVFTVESNTLVFCADESDRFTYTDVADGDRFVAFKAIEPLVQNLIFVDIVDIQEDYFIGVDVHETRWKIHSMYDPITEDMERCWVVYYGEPYKLDGEEAQYEVNAPQCWLNNKENPKGIEEILDYLEYDIDGDGANEELYLSRVFFGKFGNSTVCCLLSVWEGDQCKYEVQFDPLYILEGALNEFRFEMHYAMPITSTPAYANVYAFVMRDGQLCVVSPSGSKYVSTGEMKLFEVLFENGQLRVEKVE